MNMGFFKPIFIIVVLYDTAIQSCPYDVIVMGLVFYGYRALYWDHLFEVG